ncbi:hypothetical protein pneo_cds_793 [Pandoravirus neocaledonia]|uniref:Uncharacterized protein n=1 Tax=Pandoravirus neocaledonia TaxID=2107708 RepID=A0A2U7UDJ7_9VIRU|nr:hypothetical protein pneo_cds_793 [Pandoravirus neocaledonia]AVK76400.1 hypothetical protein pneo_cds_793 [Pandoravirus neocaledonia]
MQATDVNPQAEPNITIFAQLFCRVFDGYELAKLAPSKRDKLRESFFSPPTSAPRFAPSRYDSLLNSDLRRNSVTLDGLREKLNGTKVSSSFGRQLRPSRRRGKTVKMARYKFEMIWAVDCDAEKVVLHQDESDSQQFYVLRYFGAGEHEQYEGYLNALALRWGQKHDIPRISKDEERDGFMCLGILAIE